MIKTKPLFDHKNIIKNKNDIFDHATSVMKSINIELIIQKK